MQQIHQDICDVFRHHLIPESQSDDVSWTQIYDVLQSIDPGTYTQSVLLELRSKFEFSAIKDKEVAKELVSLQRLMEWIFRYDSERQASPSVGPKLLRSKSKLGVSSSSGEPGLVKRQKSLDVERGLTDEIFRVRTAAGSVILSLTEAELPGMTVAEVRAQVSSAVEKIIEEVKLFWEVRELQDDDSLIDLAEHRPVEVLLITQMLPQFDDALPALDQLDTLRAMIMSSSHEYQATAAKEIRKLLSQENAPPIDEIAASPGMIPRLLELSKQTETEPRLPPSRAPCINKAF